MSTNEFESAVAAKLLGEHETDTPAVEETETPPAVDETTAPAAATEPPAAAVTDEEKQLLAGKYESPEELERGYQELRRHLSEQGAELVELRRLRAEFDQLRGQVEAPKHDYDALIEDDPASAAQLAYDAGDAYHLQGAINAWKAEDPFAAAVWVSRTANQAELARVTQHYEARLGVHDASAEQEQLSGTLATFAQTNPDVQQIAPKMLEVAEELQAENSPMLEMLKNGDPRTKVRVFDYLAKEARARLGVATPVPTPATAAVDESATATAAAAALAAGGGGPVPTRTAAAAPAAEGAAELKKAFREHFGLTPLQ